MKSIILPLLLLFTVQAFAKEDLSKLNPLSGRGLFKTEKITTGELVDLQLELNLQDGFFAYHDKFSLKVTNPKNVASGELFISPIVNFDDKISKKQKKGVKGSATLKTQLQFPDNLNSDISSVDLELTYIACTEKFCLTPRVLKINIPIAISSESNTKGNSVSQTDFIKEQIESNLLYALVLIFFFGFLTSLTPCVYPLIPITLAVLGTKEDRSKLHSFLISISYVVGIGLTYALLGVIAAQTGQLFGAFIGHPIVIIAMSLIFFIMALSLIGLFELQLPAFIRNRLANTKTNKGFLGAFLSGLLAGVIASPCVGPVLVGVLAYIAQTQNSSLGFILLFTFAMGFGLLFIALGTFSQFASRLPRSGAWMNTIKYILAACLMGMSLYYAWPLVKNHLPQSSTTAKKSDVEWQKFHPSLVKKAKADGKPVIIDFYADWCASCVEMDQLTFSVKEVANKSKEFVMLKVDATTPFDELLDWQQAYKVYGLPTMIFINSKGKILEDNVLTGFEEAPLFLKRMDRTLNNTQSPDQVGISNQ
jgi:thiol:disulfide interchange protein DsbD